MMKKLVAVVIGLMVGFSFLNGQYIPVHIANSGIYEFLDELAARKIIDLNSSLRPYSRTLIAEKLSEAEQKEELLSPRQLKELRFYLKDYYEAAQAYGETRPVGSASVTSWAWINKPAKQRMHFFHYTDSVFNITVNPILGTDRWSNDSGSFNHWWNGIETYASYGNFSLFASLRDNHESVELTSRDFINQRIGGANIKVLRSGQRDYEEMRGGMAYTWKWGQIGLLMDQFSWGDAANGSNIFSGRTPAFARIDLQLNPAEWLQFNYLHGWLISEEVDSTLSFFAVNSYGSEYREVYRPKFLASNMFTFKPFNHFYVAVGNSVIHDFQRPHAAYLIPVMFWKGVDHTYNANIDNMNSQLFLTLSSRNIKGLHLYGSAFIDEIAVKRIFQEGLYNFTSYKLGATSFQLPATSLTFEYTWSNALVFRHFVPTTTFESNKYNLGHFLEDNATDLYAAIEIRPFRAMKIRGYYNYSEKGPDHTLLGTGNRITIKPLDPVVWTSSRTGISTSLQIINDLYVHINYEWRVVTGDQEWIEIWTPEVYYGRSGTLGVGVRYGL